MALEPLIPAERPMSYRRYLLLKELAARALGYEAVALTWKGYRLERTSGTALPDNFPFRALLVSIGYTTWDELDGATVEELTGYTPLGTSDARSVLSSVASLFDSLDDA
jgi:hypothetical protein